MTKAKDFTRAYNVTLHKLTEMIAFRDKWNCKQMYATFNISKHIFINACKMHGVELGKWGVNCPKIEEAIKLLLGGFTAKRAAEKAGVNHRRLYKEFKLRVLVMPTFKSLVARHKELRKMSFKERDSLGCERRARVVRRNLDGCARRRRFIFVSPI